MKFLETISTTESIGFGGLAGAGKTTLVEAIAYRLNRLCIFHDQAFSAFVCGASWIFPKEGSSNAFMDDKISQFEAQLKRALSQSNAITDCPYAAINYIVVAPPQEQLTRLVARDRPSVHRDVKIARLLAQSEFTKIQINRTKDFAGLVQAHYKLELVPGDVMDYRKSPGKILRLADVEPIDINTLISWQSRDLVTACLGFLYEKISGNALIQKAEDLVAEFSREK